MASIGVTARVIIAAVATMNLSILAPVLQRVTLAGPRAAGSWELVARAPSPPGEATLLVDGRVLVAGRTGTESDAEIFDPIADRWTEVALSRWFPPGPRVPLRDGRVLVIDTTNDRPADRPILLYDPRGNSWSDGRPPGRPISTSFTLTLLPAGPRSRCGDACGNVLLVGDSCAGGRSVAQLYDPTADRWSPAIPLVALHRCSATAQVLPSGRVLIAGGDANGDNSYPLRTAELFDPLSMAFVPTGSMHYAGQRLAATLSDGRVLMVGPGQGGGNLFQGASQAVLEPRSAELYDPATGVWISAGSTQEEVSSDSSQLIPLGAGSALLVDRDRPPDRAAEIFDPADGTWSVTAAMRASPGPAALLNRRPCGLRCGQVLMVSDDDARTQVYTPSVPVALSAPVALPPAGRSTALRRPPEDGRFPWWAVVTSAATMAAGTALGLRRRSGRTHVRPPHR